MAAKLLAAGLLLAGAAAFAQGPAASPTSSGQAADGTPAQPGQVLHFTKKANTPAVPAGLPPLNTSDIRKPAYPSGQGALKTVREPSSVRMNSPANIQQTRFQGAPAGADESLQPNIQLEPPGILRWSRLETEAAFHERLRQEARERPTTEPPVEFPPEPVVTGGGPLERSFAPMTEFAEPNYVCHGRLFFEQINQERYGWDLGFIDPLVSAGGFFLDLVALPYKIGTDPCRFYECSAGYCLPGDPVPMLLYPPEFSITGSWTEAATIVGLLAIFP
jgi:hypothetical protein